MRTRTFVVAMAMALTATALRAQDLAVKTNILADATLSPNLGIETAIARQWTLDVEGEYNGWILSHGHRWKHWAVQPEARYWLGRRLAKHFLGVHVQGGQYNIGGFNGGINFLGSDLRKLSGTRYQGWFLGAGVSYGYAFVLNRNWNVETEVGIGWSYTRYDTFTCVNCGTKDLEDAPHNYVGPTRLAVNLVYVF